MVDYVSKLEERDIEGSQKHMQRMRGSLFPQIIVDSEDEEDVEGDGPDATERADSDGYLVAHVVVGTVGDEEDGEVYEGGGDYPTNVELEGELEQPPLAVGGGLDVVLGLVELGEEAEDGEHKDECEPVNLKGEGNRPD